MALEDGKENSRLRHYLCNLHSYFISNTPVNQQLLNGTCKSSLLKGLGSANEIHLR